MNYILFIKFPTSISRRYTVYNTEIYFVQIQYLGVVKFFINESISLSRNFVVMPMCGIVQGRGWQIITVALEPKSCGEYCENWDLIINKTQKVIKYHQSSLTALTAPVYSRISLRYTLVECALKTLCVV